MATYKAPLSDLQFLFEDVFRIDTFWNSIGSPGDIDLSLGYTILNEAARFAEQELAPLNRRADEEGCHFKDGKVSAPVGFNKAYQMFCEGGWNSLGGESQFGGMGLPKTLITAVEEMVQGACMAFGLAPMATASAAFAIYSHASDKLKTLYLEKMYAGTWSGCMALTEAQAGSDLGLIRTKAIPLDDGSYAITGTKIFITWGEHDMAENIVHLVLAKLPNAPEGTKGISLFLVPKFLPNEVGDPGTRNALNCSSIEHKMGLHASPTCIMNFEAATGWLIGEVNQGLQAMFTMMNSMRLLVGINGVGVAEASYQNARAYAKERLQGRGPAYDSASRKAEADPLLRHPDVRRMLMTMKANNEAGRAFYIYVASYLDLSQFGVGQIKTRAEKLVAFLTPLAKAFLTDMSFETTILGQQIFGGYGYIRESAQEQFVRDIRVTQIYEGTNGIQGIDLLKRKTILCKGEYLALFIEEIETFILQNPHKKLKQFNDELSRVMTSLKDITHYVIGRDSEDRYLSAIARDYLHFCGYLAFAFMWARMAAASVAEDTPLKRNKFSTAHFYFAYLLPQTETLGKRIHIKTDTLMSIPEEDF